MPLARKGTGPRQTVTHQAAIEEATKEKVRRLNVNLPASKYQMLKIKAAQEETTISALIEKWVNEYLSK